MNKRRKNRQHSHSFSGMRLDAGETIYFVNSLESIANTVYNERFPEFAWRTMVPVRILGEAEDDIVFRQYTGVGMAQFIAAYSDDLPRVDLASTESRVSVRDLGDSYGVTVKEVRKARRAGVDVSAQKAIMARRAIETKFERTAELGAAKWGLYGLLNQPNVPVDAATTGNWTGGATPAQIVADINGAVQGMRDDTARVEAPTDLVLPDEQYNYIATTPYQAGVETTILDFVLRTNRYIKTITPWDALKGAGAGATDRALLYRKSPDVVEAPIREFEQLDGQPRNLEVVVNCLAASGGVICHLPLAMRYIDGI